MQPPKTSTCYLYNTYNTKHCYCLHCGFPAIQPAQTIASCHTIFPYDLSNGLRMSLANANKQRLELTILVALQSNNWRWIAWSASPEHQRMWLISRLEMYDSVGGTNAIQISRRWWKLPHPPKVCRSRTPQLNHINCCCSVYMDVLYCVALCCEVAWCIPCVMASWHHRWVKAWHLRSIESCTPVQVWSETLRKSHPWRPWRLLAPHDTQTRRHTQKCKIV